MAVALKVLRRAKERVRRLQEFGEDVDPVLEYDEYNRYIDNPAVEVEYTWEAEWEDVRDLANERARGAQGGYEPPVVPRWGAEDPVQHRRYMLGRGALPRGDNNLEGMMRKLKTPIFDGNDPDGWLYKVERYFDAIGFSEAERLQAMAICFE